jgi:hypothetical protein
VVSGVPRRGGFGPGGAPHRAANPGGDRIAEATASDPPWAAHRKKTNKKRILKLSLNLSVGLLRLVYVIVLFIYIHFKLTEACTKSF